MELKIKTFEELTALELFAIYRLRVSVFVVEQACPYQEVDDDDLSALHVWLEDDGGIAAYLRVLPPDGPEAPAHIGRVISARRGQGLGAAVVRHGITAAFSAFGRRTIEIEAQSYAIGFYEKLGFAVTGGQFLLDGIPHVKMELLPDRGC